MTCALHLSPSLSLLLITLLAALCLIIFTAIFLFHPSFILFFLPASLPPFLSYFLTFFLPFFPPYFLSSFLPSFLVPSSLPSFFSSFLYLQFHSSFSLGGFAKSLQERLMSLPVYDSCRPSSRYFSFNEKQPDSSITAINKNMENMENISFNHRNNNTFSHDHLNGFNTNNNSNINEHTVQGPSADENSFGVFLTKNYRFVI